MSVLDALVNDAEAVVWGMMRLKLSAVEWWYLQNIYDGLTEVVSEPESLGCDVPEIHGLLHGLLQLKKKFNL